MDEVEVECKAGTYPNLDDIVVEDDGPTLLLPCIVCNKTFKPEVLQRHSKVCEKSTTKKRKTFDSFKQRIQGTDLAEFLPYSAVQKRISASDKQLSPLKASSRWKENHEAFVSAIRAARGEGPDASGGSGDSRSVLRPPDHEQCPYCERHFGRKAFDRHQEWCREQHSRQPPVTASSQAKERLEARIKYRAPPIRSKRAITREKYSPLVQRKVRQISPCGNSNLSSNSPTGSATSSSGSTKHTLQSQQEQSNRLSKSGNSLSGRSQPKESPNAQGLNRGVVGRTSLRSSQRAMPRPTSPCKSSAVSGKVATSPTQRQFPDEYRGILSKEEKTATSKSVRKQLSRNLSLKQNDPPNFDSSKMAFEKIAASISTSTTDAQNLQIEVNSQENTNNMKSSKNEQLWRQGCHAKHTTLNSLSSNPHSSAPSSTVTRRNLLREKKGKKMCLFRCKTNSIEVNSLMTEMIVTPICTQASRIGGPRFVKSISSPYTRNEGGKIRYADFPDVGSMFVGRMGSGELPADSDAGSISSLPLSSSETPDSSSCSADSNRTYITQSSVCCKVDIEDVGCNQLGRGYSEHNLKLNNMDQPLDQSHGNGQPQGESGFYSVSQTKIRGKPYLQSEAQQSNRNSLCSTEKKTSCQDLLEVSSDSSDIEKSTQRKRVRSWMKLQKCRMSHEDFQRPSSKCIATPVCLRKKPYSHESIKFETISNSGLSFPRVLSGVKNKHSCNSSSGDSEICTRDMRLPACERTFTNGLSTTWCDIAKSGNQASQYIIFNTQQNSHQHGLSGHGCCLNRKLHVNENQDMSQLKLSLQCVTTNEDWTKETGHEAHSPKCLKKSSAMPVTNIYRERMPSVLSKSEDMLHLNLNSNPGEVDLQKMKGNKIRFPKLVFGGVQNSPEEKPHFLSCQVNGPAYEKVTRSPNMKRKLPNVRLSPLPVSLGLSGSRHEEPYDPYASAERQMMELLRSDSACNINKKQKQKSNSPAPSISPMPSPTHSPKPSPLETSPASAFTRYAKELELDSQALIGQESENTFMPENHFIKEKSLLESLPEKTSKLVLTESQEDREVRSNHQTSSRNDVTGSEMVPRTKPQPPPRSNRRLASLSHSKNLDELVVSGVSVSQPQFQASQSIEAVPHHDESESHNLDNRPKTYDVDSSRFERRENCSWSNAKESLSKELECPVVIDTADGGKVEVLNLENRVDRKERRETRESREVREITEQESNISDIDNLLEEVVRMQRSVSMLSEVDSGNLKDITPVNQSSARSRRNRTGKMHIEDYLFPAEMLEGENNNFRDSSDPSYSVFGSTKSRKSSSKGRRLIEDMLFPPGLDFNANSDNNNEDEDVVVSANALTYMSQGEISSKIDSFVSHYPTSPVSLTSKAPNAIDNSDGIPRPKPMSLSHSSSSSTRNGCNGEKESNSFPTSPMQPPNKSRQSTSSRLSADSAYSSLNRRSPLPQVQRQCPGGMQDVHRPGAESPQSILSQSLTQSLVLSSSGSESSLPPLSTSQLLKRGSQSTHECDTPSSDIVSATTPLPKLSKFCHQCGTKFLITAAKFCHECGAARLEIC